MSKAGWCACTSAKLLVLAQRNPVAEQEAFSLNPPTPSQLSIFFCAIVCFFPLHHLFAILWGWLKRQEHINQVRIFYNKNPNISSFLGFNSITCGSTYNIYCICSS